MCDYYADITGCLIPVNLTLGNLKSLALAVVLAKQRVFKDQWILGRHPWLSIEHC